MMLAIRFDVNNEGHRGTRCYTRPSTHTLPSWEREQKQLERELAKARLVVDVPANCTRGDALRERGQWRTSERHDPENLACEAPGGRHESKVEQPHLRTSPLPCTAERSYSPAIAADQEIRWRTPAINGGLLSLASIVQRSRGPVTDCAAAPVSGMVSI
jgi:hypothetical protein